ncbi:hypothetical protein [Xanthobacter versatilis]|uniref:hypothetical protein n=1 Tax=Xanthobacter autotrophicus (strain ATCC BAA-1158 / Py2) TaxID=78245 RepID=UPI003727F586
MADTFLLEKTPRGFVPAFPQDADDASAIPMGTQLCVSMPSKSGKANRFFWALMTHVGNALGIDKRSLATELLVKLNRVEAFQFTDGRMQVVPRSIAAMKVDEFRSFLDEVILLLITHHLPDMSRDRLLAEVLRMCGVSYADIMGGRR